MSDTDILINVDELRVRRAYAYNSPAYYRCFVYLEFAPMTPTGLYEHAEIGIEAVQRDLEAVSEEYAIFKGHLITRAEYDDGAALIDGRIVDTRGGSELRRRYITAYNIVLASQASPINNNAFDDHLDKIMNGMLRGTVAIDDLVDAVNRLPRKWELER